ncbi:TIGR02099 family protein [Colwellia sp. MB3u-70]|uniref:YhdP family protein n=1 Tax=unclassified Colwellia TaxID=196834 RepID=UPI0015F58C48|nr:MULTISPECIES: YhdP family protein [unclassified Colwellia]MBA6293390.1 TIGR02099 family protein [Colwellia sp. MB3u-8]MBA6307952.1 TIGR02099 family protein [Colwellia sp. MB3u-70]
MSVSTVLNRWLKRLYKLLAILLVAFAVSISLLRLFLPYAHNYRQTVEDYLNNSYNSNISIGSLSMGWGQLGPTLITQQVELLSNNKSKVYFESLAVELDFWRSMRSGKLVTQDFVISGAELVFEQAALANSAAEISANEADNKDLITSLSSILLEQISRFSIRDSHVLYHTLAGVRAFTINEMFWTNENNQHRANGTIIVDGLSSNNLKVLLDFQGPRFDQLSGQAYLEANDIDITPWLGRLLAIKDAKTHSAINFSAWLKLNTGKPEFIQLALGDNEITWQHQGKAQKFEIIGGDIQIKTLDESAFNLVTSPLIVKRNGTETNKISLMAEVNGTHINGYINAIELASFAGVSPLLVDDVGLEKLLLDLDAVGRVEDIHFRSTADNFAITAAFSDVDSHFSQGIPGIDNVSGELVYANHQLQISLSAVDGALDFDKHFKYPIPYTRLTSLINAKFSADDWQFSVENIVFNSPQLSLNADVKINRFKDQAITMSLLASASEGNAEFAEYFYPHLLMGEGLVNYLNGAIVDGKVKQALVLFNGPLNSFPFNHSEGVFVVDAELSESTFKFDPQWPAIENFAANLNFSNNSMLITGREGTLSGIDVTGVQAAIAELTGSQVLTVDVDITQTEPQLVRQLMAASPMQKTVGVTLEQVVVSAPINGHFSLTLPLNNPAAVMAKGYVEFKNNHVALQTPRMDFSQVNGRLDYQNDLITVSGIELDWRGMPLTINVSAQQKPDFYNVSIETLGQWQTCQWQRQLPDELVKYADGKIDWQGMLALNISDDKFNYDYQIHSSLDEVNLALPAPFSKRIGEQVAVKIHAFGNKLNSTINADMGDELGFYALLNHQQTRFSLAHLVLGKQTLESPISGFHISADLAQANYQQWQPLVLDILAAVESTADKLNSSAVPSEIKTHEQSLLSAPDKIQGQVGNLMVYDKNFQQVNFDFIPESDGWLLNINAKELKGSAKFYPDWHQQGIDINADFVHLSSAKNELVPAQSIEASVDNTLVDSTSVDKTVTDENLIAEAEVTEETKSGSTASVKPAPTHKVEPAVGELKQTQQSNIATESELINSVKQPISPPIDTVSNAEIFANVPPLKVTCASCQYDNYDFGEVNFTLERADENTLLLKNVTTKRGNNALAFNVQWQQDNEGSNTRVTGTLATDDVAGEIAQLGYVSIIKDSGVEMKYELDWQGGPHDFATASLNGELSTTFDDGYLADVDDKGVRILSLLSLQSLVRKLSFDFRDIFSDGMFYSELKGSFMVKDGVAYTDNVQMSGTAGDLTIVGNTNLNNGDLDYRMSYKPNLTSSLPVLAWIATLNPVTFLAGMALDEVITSTVIAEINFEVTGNLDDPQFKQVSRKNQNISVGRSSPPKIVENISADAAKMKASEQPEKQPF